MKTLGDWLDGSGWTAALQNSNIVSSGKTEAMLHASHITHARHAHQVTAACLYILQNRAYSAYISAADDDLSVLDFETWCITESVLYAQFYFWSITLKLELLLLTLVRSFRSGDFTLYVECLSQLVPWFFALNHHHYARWVSVHLRDMLSLSTTHPGIYAEFKAGKFVVHRSKKPFSAIAIDHAHEQMNARVKGSGGAIGLTENPHALLRWMVAGPEISQLVEDFEVAACTDQSHDESKHHDQTKAKQAAFFREVNSLLTAFEELGNPFMEETVDLFAIDTKNICSPEAVSALRAVENAGLDQYRTFVEERLVKKSKPLNDPISKNMFSIFNLPNTNRKRLVNNKLVSATNDHQLFSRLYIACQMRDGDLDSFFQHENQSFPPAISENGEIRFGTKSDLLTCLATSSNTVANVDAIIVDGAAIVQMYPQQCKTFDDHAMNVFIPYISKQLDSVCRLDVIWDRYLPCGLKAATRSKRGAGVRCSVMPNVCIRKNWSQFLHVNENKSELFDFLSEQTIHVLANSGKQTVATKGDSVLAFSLTELSLNTLKSALTRKQIQDYCCMLHMLLVLATLK